MTPPNNKKHLLFLMSDTGGGHRASMNAIVAGLHERYGEDSFTWSYIDVLRHMRFPNSIAPELYPHLVKEFRPFWALTYNILDDTRRSNWYSKYLYTANKHRLSRMVEDNPADVVICVHSLAARPTMDAYLTQEKRPPFLTVVTDLFTTPYFWYDKRIEHHLVPTQRAFERGLEMGVPAEKMTITGLPVHPQFMHKLMDKSEARRELGWDPDRPAVLIVGGSDGMGPLYEVATELNAMNLNCQLAIVAGRNTRLAQRLRAVKWNQPTHIYPFIDYMPKLMAASNILVTKAGPSSICEAMIAGLPVVLYDRIPGQEEGNVEFVVQKNIGVYAPQPPQAAAHVRDWLAQGPQGLQQYADRAQSYAVPEASFKIADEIWKYVERG